MDGVSQSELVRATGIDRSPLADLVARMISKGLLERERSATDARANTVRLSDAGRVALAEGGRPATQSDQRLLQLLPPKKRESFLKTLSTLAAAADAAAGSKVAPAPEIPAKERSSKGAKTKPKSSKKKLKKPKKQAKAA